MVEIGTAQYSPIELVKVLLREQGIHEGHWVLGVQFGFTAMNVGTVESGEDVCPGGVVAVQKIALQRIPVKQPFSVDAELANPAPKKPKAKLIK